MRKSKPLLARTANQKRWHIEHDVRSRRTYCDEFTLNDQGIWKLLDHLADDLDTLNLCEECMIGWELYEPQPDDDLMGVANQHMASIMGKVTFTPDVEDFGEWLEAS